MDLKHLARIREGVTKWNRWRKDKGANKPNLNGAHLFQEDLSGADLTGADLSHIYLSGANLSGADLTGANLFQANLSSANLAAADLFRANLNAAGLFQANLSAANLSGAEFAGANLNSANLAAANLNTANFRGAYLTGADLTGAKLNATIFADTDLRKAKGLGLCIHDGPSTIGIDTFFRSNGHIPETFLRGCGVPEHFITYSASLLAQPIEFYSCFISYSSQDQLFAERLNADLRAKNLRCWFAPEDLKIGDRFQERIEESIRLFDKVMIILSSASVQSRWVDREMNAAREREDREKRTVLFPIRLDDTVMNAPQPWAADIRRSRHIGDFRGWRLTVHT